MSSRPSATALLLGLCLSFGVVATAAAALADELAEVARLQRAGQPAAALERVDRYLASQPRDAQMRFQKAVLLADAGRTAEAIAVLVPLTQDFPELAEPHNNLAALHAAAGDYPKARAELEEALRLNPSYAPAHENLGDVLVVLASQSYARAARLEPGSTTLPRKLVLARDLVAPTQARTRTTIPPPPAASASR